MKAINPPGYWQELASRWTPKCGGCKQPTGTRGNASDEVCWNEACKYHGMSPSQRYKAFSKKVLTP